MQLKWRVYSLTLLTYAVVHSLRTMWSALKSNLAAPPFNYHLSFLGAVDMLLLFLLALFMTILGPKVEIYGPKKCLFLSLACLFAFNSLVGICLNLGLTSQWLYVVFFAFGIGISSSTAWPSCLYMLSLFFDKRNGITLSAWNGTSQLGDFISLISVFAVVSTNQWKPESSFFLGSSYILMMLVLIAAFIPEQLKSDIVGQKQRKPQEEEVAHVELKEDMVIEEKEGELEKKIETESQGSEQAATQKEDRKGTSGPQEVKQTVENGKGKIVNMLTVWCLPGVALNVLAYGFIKSVNSLIVSWLVYYLISLGLGAEAILVTILWSVSVFLGGILCGIINRQLKRIFFVFELVGATIAFLLLQSFHIRVYQAEIIILIILCALFYGGPYSLMGTAIPITLANQEEVKLYQNGKAAIISLVEGFGLFFSGITLILTPSLGIGNIHFVGAAYCFIAAVLLLGEIYRTRSGGGGQQGKEMV